MYWFTFIWMVTSFKVWCNGNMIREMLKLTDPAGEEWDYFGYHIAACNDIVAVGGKEKNLAIYDRDNLKANSSGTTLPISSKISGSNGIACNDNFLVYVTYPNIISIRSTKKPYTHVQTLTDNAAISIDNLKIDRNNTIFYSDSWHNSFQGIIKGYKRNLSSWIQFTISSPSSAFGNFFGHTLTVNSMYMAAGTPQMDDRKGTVHLYQVNSNTGLYDIALTINPPTNAPPGDGFGNSISMNEDWLVIGRSSNKGEVFVYKYQPMQSNYIYHQTLTPTNVQAVESEFFGYRLAVEGNTMVLCDYGENFNNTFDRGACYLFKLDTDTWSYTSVLIPSDPKDRDNFGWTVVMNNGTIFVTSGNTMRSFRIGAVYVYSEETKDSTTTNTTATSSTTANITAATTREGTTTIAPGNTTSAPEGTTTMAQGKTTSTPEVTRTVAPENTTSAPESPRVNTTTSTRSTKSTGEDSNGSGESNGDLSKSVCETNNGGCGADFNCFALNETESICRCPKGRYQDTTTSTLSCKLPKSVLQVEGLTLNETCKQVYLELSHPVTLKYIETIEKAVFDNLVSKIGDLLSVKVTVLKCGSVKPTLEMYFRSKKAPNNVIEVFEESIKNNELDSVKTIKGTTSMVSTSLGRCEVEGNLCGGHGTCSSREGFTYKCNCKPDYEEEYGTCVKDDDLGLKIGLPVVLIILTVLFVVFIIRTRRKEQERSKPTQGDLNSRNNPAYDP